MIRRDGRRETGDGRGSGRLLYRGNNEHGLSKECKRVGVVGGGDMVGSEDVLEVKMSYQAQEEAQIRKK